MLRKLMHSILGANAWLLFFLFCLLSWLFSFLNNEFVVTEQLYDSYIEEKMQEKYGEYDKTVDEFDDDIEESDSDDSYWTDNLIDFSLLILQVVIQLSLITAFVYVALTLANVNEEVSFSITFKAVTVAEFIFFIPKFIKYSWFIIWENGYTFQDVRDFHPFSLYGLLKQFGEINSWLVYPLKFVNIFEVFYIFILVVGVSIVYKVRASEVSVPVISAYLSLMFLWISLRIYISTIL
jgi:hypothetical protein